jgi:membrane-bound metal-dependent hydrolase YbcI (DUF457 family)
MPTPVGHPLAGLNLWVYRSRKDRRDCLLFIFLSCLPDIDLIPGILIGNPLKYHHLLTHSLLFTFIVALIWSFLFHKKWGYIQSFLIAFGLICSHIFLDTMNTNDRGNPRMGVKIFYPFYDSRVIFPWGFFLAIRPKSLLDLVSFRAIVEYLREGILFSIPVAIYYGLKGLIKKK